MMEKSLPKVQGGYEIKGVIYPYHKDLIEGISQGLIKKGDIPDDLYNVAKSYTEPGALYTADLPDEMVDRMVDYDAPIGSQPEPVKQALRTAFGDYAIKYASGNDMTWKDFKSMFGFTDEAKFAEQMRKSGISGIKYADAGSRGQGGSGTRNFVVFPGEEKKVKILKRE